MKLDLNTEYLAEVDKYLSADDKNTIKDAVRRVFGGFESITIGQWANCIDGKFEAVIGEIRGTWLQVYWLQGFKDFATSFPDMLKNLSPKMDADEEQAASGLLQTSLVESVLVFARSYFGLKSFREAEDITLGEVLIAKKATYNETMYRKKLAKIQINNAKHRTK